MITKGISGGQSGADRSFLDFLIDHGLPQGGECPKGRRSESGRIPARYQLTENADWRYNKRTEVNVVNSDATIIFKWNPHSPGSVLTENYCWAFNKPCLTLTTKNIEEAETQIREWLREKDVKVLNVAGNRESSAPGLHAFVYQVWKRCLDLFAAAV